MRSRWPKANKSSKVPRSHKFLLWTLLGAIIVIAIVIPLGVMFGKKKKASAPKASILVPLYVYPSPGAWDPLFDAVTAHPTLNFTVVVNPASGPGTGAGPDSNYTSSITRLNSHANVRTIGYVSTDYAKRELGAILRDLKTYAAWSENATVTGLGMKGIFLDETPSQYDDASAQFFETIAAGIRSESGLGKDPLIIHNPGTIPDPRYLSSCDVSVVFEGTYSTYQIYGFSKTISSFLGNKPATANGMRASRDNLAVIIHALPDLNEKDMDSLLRGVKDVAGSVFVTGLKEDYYASFWNGFGNFTGTILDG